MQLLEPEPPTPPTGAPLYGLLRGGAGVRGVRALRLLGGCLWSVSRTLKRYHLGRQLVTLALGLLATPALLFELRPQRRLGVLGKFDADTQLRRLGGPGLQSVYDVTQSFVDIRS